MSYVPCNREERDEMLRDVGVGSFEELLTAIPRHLRLAKNLNLPPEMSEWEVRRYMAVLAGKNIDSSSHDVYLGGGSYDHFSPAAVDAIISRPEFATAYTPYQAEVSQGTLQSIYEFQSMFARLTGMDVVNASMYDGASAAAEAVLLAMRLTNRKKVLYSAGLNPLYLEVIRTYTSGIESELLRIPDADGLVNRDRIDELIGDDVACLVIQSPNFYGLVEDHAGLKSRLGKALLISVCNPISLGLLKPPGAFDVDICVGEAQHLGNSISYGGPGVGLFAAREEFIRKLPGRLVARTTDAEGQIGYTLTLQTREQHIRRDKATSNICTNQALCALANAVYLSLLGKSGIVEVGEICVQNAHYLARKITEINGFGMRYPGAFFNEFVVTTPVDALDILKELEADRILAGIPLSWFDSDRKRELLIAVTEKRKKDDLDRFVSALSRFV